MYHICRGPMPNPIGNGEERRFRGRPFRARTGAAQRLAELALAVGAAVAGLDQRRRPRRVRSPLDLGEAGHDQPRLVGDRQGLQAVARQKPFDLSRRRSAGASALAFRPREKACFFTASATSSLAAVTQTPRPGNLRLISGDDASSGPRTKRIIRPGGVWRVTMQVRSAPAVRRRPLRQRPAAVPAPRSSRSRLSA